MAHQITLPEDVYAAVLEEARQDGATVEEWIAGRLPSRARRSATPTSEDVSRANALLRETIVDYGRSTGLDNEAIDADLARAYADDHDPTPGW